MCRSTLQHLTSILWISVALLPNLIPVQGVPLVLTLSDTPLLKQPATTSDAAHDGSSFTIQEDTAPTRISVSEAFSKPSLTLAAKISNFPDSGSQIVDEPTPDKPSSPQSVLATQTYVLSNKSSLEEAKEPSSRLHSTELPAITDTPVQTFEVTDAEITSLSPLSDVVGSTDSITTDSSISTVSTTIIASYTQPTAKPTFAVESMLTVENSDTFSSDISASIPFTSIAEITHLSRSSTLFVDRSSPVPLLSSPPPGETGVDIASIVPTSTVDLPTPDHHAAIQSHTSINPNHDIISTQEQTHTLSDPHSLRIGVEILLSTESMSDGPNTISESSSILTFSINDQLSTTIPGSLPIVTAIPEPANSPSTTFQISSLSENSTKNSVKTQTSDGIPVSTDTTAIVVVLATSETIFDSATVSTTTSAGVSILDFTPTAIPTAFPTTLTPEQISSILAHTSLGFDPKILIVNLPSINQPDAPSPSTPIVVPAPAPSSAPPVEIPPAPLPQITLPIIISDVPVVIPSVIPLPQITPPIIISDVPVVIPSVIPLPQITPPIVISDAPVVIPSVIPLPQISIPTASETVVLPTNTPIQVSLPSQPTAFPTTLTPEQISSILAHTSLGFDPKILIVNLPSINQPDAPSPSTPIVVPAPAPSSAPPVEIPPAPLPQITLPIIISDVPVVIPSVIPLPQITPPIIISDVPVVIPSVIPLPQITPPIIISDVPVVIPSVIPLPQISIPTASETVVLPTNTPIQVSLPSQPTAFPTTLTPEQISSILAHTSLGFDPKILIVNLPSINQPDAPSPSTPIVVPAPAPSSVPPVEIPPAPLPQITLPIIISDVPVVIPSVIPLPQITPPIIISDVPVVIPSVIPLPQITPPIVISDVPVVVPSVIPLPQISIPTASETVVLPTNTLIQVSLPSQPTAFPTTLTPEQISSILAHTSLGFDPKILIVNLPSINQPDAPSSSTPIVVPAPIPSSVPPVEIPPAPLPQITLPIIISDVPVVIPSVIPLPQITPPIIISDVPVVIPSVIPLPQITPPIVISDVPVVIPSVIPLPQISIPTASETVVLPTNTLIQVSLPSQPTAFPTTLTPEQISSILAHTSLGFDPKILIVNLPSINQPDAPSSSTPIVVPAPIPSSAPPVEIPPAPLPQITLPIIISDVPVVIPSVIPLPQITPPIVISDVPVVIPSVIPLPQISIPTASETVVLPTNTLIQVSLPSQPTAFPTTLTPEQISSILAHTSLGFDPKILIVNLPSINQPDAPSPSTPIVVPAPIPSSVPPVEIPPAPLPQITLPIIISDVPVVIPSVIPLPQISIPTASETVVLPTNTLIQVSLPSQPTAFPTTLTPEQISSILAHTSLGFDPKILIVNLPSINQPDAPSSSTPIVVPAPIPSSVPPVEIPPAPLPQITLPIIISDVPVVIPSVIPLPQITPPIIISDVPVVIPSVIPLPQITPPIIISDVPVVIPSVIPLPQISIPTASETVVLPTNTLIQVSLPSQPTAFPTTLTPEQISSILAHTSLGFDPKILIVNLPSINQPDAPSPSTPIVVPAPAPSSAPPVEIPPAPLPQITLPIIISDVPVVIPSVIPLPQITPPIVISDAPVVIPSVIPLPQISIPTASETVVLPTNTLIQVSLPSQPTAFPTTLTPEQISSILAHTSLGFDPKILIVNLPSINQPDAPSSSTPIVVPAPIPSSVPPVEIPPAPLPQITLPIIISDVPVVIPSVIPLPQITPPIVISDVPVVIPSVIPLPQITPPIVISDVPVVIPSVIPLPQISIPTASETVVLPTNTLIQVSLPSQPTAFPTTLTPEQISSILAHTSLGFDPKILIVNLPSINQPDAPSPSTPIVVPAPIPSSVPPVEIPPAPLPQITLPIIISDVPVVIPSVIPLPQITPPIVISDAPVVIPSVIPLPQISIPTASETVVLPTNTLIQVSLPSQPTAFPTTLTPEQISSILAHTSLGFDPKILIVNLPSINQPDAPSSPSRLPPVLVSSTNGTPLPKDIPPLVSVFQPSFAPGPAATNTQENPSQPITSANTASGSALNITPNQRAGISVAITSPLSTGQTPVVESQPINTIGVSQAPDRSVEGNSQASVKLTLASTIISTDPSNSGSVPNTPVVSIPNASVPSGHGVFENPLAIPSATGVLPTGDTLIDGSMQSNQIESKSAPAGNVVANNPGGDIIVGGSQPKSPFSGKPGDSKADGGSSGHNGAGDAGTPSESLSGNNGMPVTVIEMLIGGVGIAFVILGSVLVVTRRGQALSPTFNAGMGPSEGGQNLGSTVGIAPASGTDTLKFSLAPLTGTKIPLGRVRSLSILSRPPPLNRIYVEGQSFIDMPPMTELSPNSSISTIYPSKQPKLVNSRSVLHHDERLTHMIDIVPTMGANAIEAEACSDCQLTPHTSPVLRSTFSNDGISVPAISRRVNCSSSYSNDGVYQTCMQLVPSKQSAYGNLGVPAYNDNMDMLHRDTTITAIPMGTKVGFPQDCDISSINLVSEYTDMTFESLPLQRRFSATESLISLKQSNISIRSGIEMSNTTHSWCISHISQPAMDDDIDEQFDPNQTFIEWRCGGQLPRALMTENPQSLAQDERVVEDSIPTGSQYDMHAITPSYEAESDSSWFDENTSGALSGAGIFAQTKHASGSARGSRHAMMATVEKDLGEFSLEFHAHQYNLHATSTQKSVKPRPFLRDDDYDMHTQSNGEWTINDTTVTGFEENSISSENTSALFSDCDDNQ
ncbi:hypothetical protein BASA61_001683 [Batrachochytrium salamandrivorans]|nr:hypothetical protein BASA61_001683 [Batrachochytrium salamandrivorans]KAH9268262.1 hypothetical protein BASA84_000279 [Batrachochytrium salamandrivorans]